MEMLILLREFGPLAGLVLFFIWKDWLREGRLTARIEKLEKDQHEIILPLVRETAEVISQNTAVMSRVESLLAKE